MNTKEKVNIADIIGQWYFSWKDRITDNGSPHRLGFAKEDLKLRLEHAFENRLGECQEPNCKMTATKDWHGQKVCDDHYDYYREESDKACRDLD